MTIMNELVGPISELSIDNYEETNPKELISKKRHCSRENRNTIAKE